ncbi:MAG: cyclohexanecarboxylate-CoA ligase [Sneathiella sp.]|jgi:cyclohexanecarboxylate-CoA ligase|uniref:AMP-binding protein n=1 Tax=Sneathiella sp. TaxID=1964365 RepID=UPI000C36B6B6|nr:AMP-binding protein [Sneathiella sp.]MAL77817.1 cyclohexanecarboxylate-CoA ligase [Sneathiella sp.]|tara:strand:+ start:492 stop:1946 length:1455 start_codon:yes stop_codon:yes gene_type:complete
MYKSHIGRAVNLTQERIDAMVNKGAWQNRLIIDYFDKWAEETPDKAAIVAYSVETGERQEISYGELQALSFQIAAMLQSRGVGLGDIVSFQLVNRIEFTAITLAAVRIGAAVNPLMPVLRTHELTHILETTQSRVLVVAGSFRGFSYEEMARDLQTKIDTLEHVIVLEEEAAFQRPATGRPDDLVNAVRPDPNELFEVMFTSGTTGRPKGVMHTANTLFANIAQTADRFRLTAADVIFCPTPMAHQLGFLFGVLSPAYCGGTAVLLDAWVPDLAVDIMEREKATLCMGATPFLTDVANFPEIRTRNLDDFRLFISGGAPIPSALVTRAIENLKAAVISIWGMTEVLAVTTVKIDDPAEKASGSDGCVTPHTEIRIVDGNGAIQPVGKEGILETRGATICVGYLNSRKPLSFAMAGSIPAIWRGWMRMVISASRAARRILSSAVGRIFPSPRSRGCCSSIRRFPPWPSWRCRMSGWGSVPAPIPA